MIIAYTINDGIIIIKHGHATTQTVTIIPKIINKTHSIKISILPNPKSTVSVSLTSLLIILPYGVVSKYLSGVFKTELTALLYNERATVTLYANNVLI